MEASMRSIERPLRMSRVSSLLVDAFGKRRGFPEPTLTACARGHGVYYGELQLLFDAVHAVQANLDAVADGKLAAVAFADDLAGILVVVVAVSRQSVQGHQAFDEHLFQLDEEAEAGGGNDQGREFVAHTVHHELDLF